MKRTMMIAGISFIFGILLAGFVFVYLPENSGHYDYAAEPTSALSSTLYASPALQPQVKAGSDFTQIVELIGPAVVKIQSERVERRQAQGDFGFDDFWNRFFDMPQGRGQDQEYRAYSQGTGFFTSPDGYIITNNHIVEKAVKTTVVTVKGDELTAEIVGTDPASDLALLKVKGENFPFAALGDSAALKVGEWVLAIGNPLGMEHTVTAGIVSAKGRQLRGQMNVPEYRDFIQTDAAINRGNSGGPLINMRGQVVGINSNILSPSGGSIGIGFAIPSNLAQKVVAQLKEKGKVVRGRIGVTISAIDEPTREVLKLADKKGAFVHDVEAGLPADEAGLKPGDVIIKVDSAVIEDDNELKFKIADVPPGEKVDLTIIRDGKEMTFSVKVIAMESDTEDSASTEEGKDIGFSVQELTPRLAQRYGFQTTEGLIVTEVRRFSEAERRGLERGDIITEVNRVKVETVKNLKDLLEKLNAGDPVMIRIVRERNRAKQEFFVTLRIPE
jgi:serine protease Do